MNRGRSGWRPKKVTLFTWSSLEQQQKEVCVCASVVGDRPANGVAAEGCVTKQAKGKVWKHLGSSDAQLMPSRASSTVTIPAGNSPPPIFEFCIFFSKSFSLNETKFPSQTGTTFHCFHCVSLHCRVSVPKYANQQYSNLLIGLGGKLLKFLWRHFHRFDVDQLPDCYDWRDWRLTRCEAAAHSRADKSAQQQTKWGETASNMRSRNVGYFNQKMNVTQGMYQAHLQRANICKWTRIEFKLFLDSSLMSVIK